MAGEACLKVNSKDAPPLPYAPHFAFLALQGITPRKYRKIPRAKETTDLQLPLAV